MKTFRVWTHNDVAPWEVEAESRKEALKKGLALAAANPPMVPAYGFEPGFAGENGQAIEWHTVPARVATAIETPYARVKSKPSTFRRW